jgi:hypothetical protein
MSTDHYRVYLVYGEDEDLMYAGDDLAKAIRIRNECVCIPADGVKIAGFGWGAEGE